MNRLDDIKARVSSNDHTMTMCNTIRKHDVPALVAAVAAVLELHALGIGDLFTAEGIEARLEHCVECTQGEHRFIVRYPCPTVAAIRTALGEEQ